MHPRAAQDRFCRQLILTTAKASTFLSSINTIIVGQFLYLDTAVFRAKNSRSQRIRRRAWLPQLQTGFSFPVNSRFYALDLEPKRGLGNVSGPVIYHKCVL